VRVAVIMFPPASTPSALLKQDIAAVTTAKQRWRRGGMLWRHASGLVASNTACS